jgi:hypothetical protein
MRRTQARDEKEYFERGKAEAKKRIADFIEKEDLENVINQDQIGLLLEDVWLVRRELIAWARDA